MRSYFGGLEVSIAEQPARGLAYSTELPATTLIDNFHWCIDLAKAPMVCSMMEWSEAAIVLPNGPFKGERYRHRRHPISRLYFGEIDSGRWSRIAATGPTQNGKTLIYHLFEICETVVVGLPTLDMANDKWTEDFLPVIEASKYRNLLPDSGEGSRGGRVKTGFTFKNGATLRFMTAGGDDKQRAAFTVRVVAITETDGMDDAGEASREADKIEQIEARTRAYGRLGKRIYLECTVSLEHGRIWQEVKHKGSDSRILRPCPLCEEWVQPEREHLVGWKECESEEEAAEKGHFICPSCFEPWSDDQRVSSSHEAKLVHRGQEIIDGEIVGDIPKTQTLGFRWSAIDNPFVSAGDLAAEEWIAGRDRDRENAEKKMRQFIWTMPYDPPDVELTPLDPTAIETRTTEFNKGIVPDDAIGITVGVDTGKRMLHWTAVASLPGGGSLIIEYDKQPVDSARIGVRKALVESLSALAKYFEDGWQSDKGRTFPATQVWIDSGWHEHTDAVYEFCKAANKTLGVEKYRPTKGYGEGQRQMTRYISPSAKKRDADVVFIGREFHIKKVRKNGRAVVIRLVHINSDHWKSELHQRLAVPTDEVQAIRLFNAASFVEHKEFSQHMVAEVQLEKFVKERGTVIVWDRVDRNNHFLDSTYAAICAGEAVRAAADEAANKPQPQSLAQLAGQK